MMNLDDQLQDRLARLESGEPLDRCAAELPAEEAEALQVVDALRSITYPTQTADSIVAQRALLLRTAAAGSIPATPKTSLSSRSRWTFPTALPWPIKFAALGALVVVIIAGLFLLRSPAPATQNLAQNPPSGSNTSHYTQYIPMTSSVVVAPDPNRAVVAEAHGILEMQKSDGQWTPIQSGQVLQAGQHIRTKDLSNAMLLFYDGSQIQLGPVTEVVLQQIDAETNGPRTILLTQLSGETDHWVASANSPGSRYAVHTPNGTGTAKGTIFHVSISPALVTRISVDDGSVAVTNVQVTVNVIAGQVTTIGTGAPPAPPVFRITGEGIVTQAGSVWRIGGIEFKTDSSTVIVGNPQVGDRVAVEGHLSPDGARIADRIVLLRRAAENRFEFTGNVELIGAAQWKIAGRTVQVNGATHIDAGIKVGDLVKADGIIRSDGTLLAEHIRLVTANSLPFAFTGLVQQIISNTWTISGVSIAVDAHTEIEAGLGAGDVVQVDGHILPDGTWLAQSIQRASQQEREFEFSGVVQSMSPWVVSGIGFTTNDQTEIDAGIKVGDRVKVQGRVLADGTWLAEEIERLADQLQRFEFVGVVTHIDPWVVSGISITVNSSTTIQSGIQVGDLVRVSGVVQTDGSLLATSIQKINEEGVCLDTRDTVVDMENDRFTLQNGETFPLSRDTQIQTSVREGVKTKVKIKDDRQIEHGSVVIVRFCVRRDETIIIISITIIHSPISTPPVVQPPRPPKRTDLCINPAGKIMRCPPGNPPSFRPFEDEDDQGEDH